MKAAVIGGGVFGCVIAADLARTGMTVDLFEARDHLLWGATARCQARLHGGYHYPRSDTTAAAARDAAPLFVARFPDAVITGNVHHYVVAEDSKVTAAEYLGFCDRLGLPYEVVEPAHARRAQVCVRVPEAFVDVPALRRLLRVDLFTAGVTVHTGRWVEPAQLDHDLIVTATYGQPWARPLRYEVCEVALIELGRYDRQSFVVVDGDHVSVDPHGRQHMFYDVAASVHTAHVGYRPALTDEYADLVNRYGPVRTPLSRHLQMRANAARHLRGVEPHGTGISIYAGSLFSVRAVLPDVDGTDERPTLVERDGNVVSVLSGKICTAATASAQVLELAGLGVAA